MNGFRFVPPARPAALLGALTGLLAGTTALALAGGAAETVGAVARDEVTQRSAPAEIEAVHLPPLLTLDGEDLTLEYGVFCVSDAVDGGEGTCEPEGAAYVRAAGRGPFSPLPLRAASSPEGRTLVAHVPEELAASPGGLEYYAVLRSGPDGPSVTVPAGAAHAPHRSLRLTAPVVVDLGSHAFGRPREADERVAQTTWGPGALEAGLEEGRNLSPIGASAFDVDRDGSVYLLDEAKDRVLVWERGRAAPRRVPVSVSGTLADLAVAPDGSMYVLETVGSATGGPLVRRFDADGRELERVATAERTASRIRMGDRGPIVLQQPSQQWMPVTSGGAIAGAQAQRERGNVGRRLPGGSEVVVLRVRDEVRVAVTGRDGARRSWLLRSRTPLGEVQLAEPLGQRIVLVVRTYTDDEAEFDVLVLDERGLVRRFAVTAAEWAETAPLGRFVLRGWSLYRLGSTAQGPFVDRFDLEVPR